MISQCVLSAGAVLLFTTLSISQAGVSPAHAQITTTDVSPDFSFGVKLTNMDGRIPGMVLDPNNNSIAYAAAEWTGVWKSTDGAHSWYQSSAGLRNGITQENAYPNLAIDAANSQRLLYASTSKDGRVCPGCDFNGLWVSIDSAGSWQHVSLCSQNGGSDNIASVVFSSGRPFVATDCGIWTTLDSKLQSGWSTMALPRGISPGGTIFAAANNSQTLFACLGDGTRVYRSLNLGQSWDGGVDVGGRCTGLAVAPISNETQPSTSVVIHTTSAPKSKSGPGSNALEVTVVNHDNGTTQNLGFANVADNGSGRSGVWTARRSSSGTEPGTAFDVFAADNFFFYHYTGNSQWSGNFSVHVDSWWLAFPNNYDGAKGNCLAYSANDGGVYANASNSCSFNGWVDASAGLHVTWGNHISGLSPAASDPFAALCAITNGGQPCPTLFDPTTDDDTFIRQAPPYVWINFPDGLGDAGAALFDPAQPNLVLAVRNGNYNLFVGPAGHLPIPGTSYYNILPQDSDFATGITAPTLEGIKVVQTMPAEIVLKNGDYLGIRSPFTTDQNHCVEDHNCGDDIIVRNMSAALGAQTAQSSWFDISPEAHFGPGQIAGIYPAGGHNTTVYVLTSNASGVNYANTPYQPGQVYSAHSQVIGEAITSWQPASGSGANSLVRAYNLFVNPYDSKELWALDLGSSPSAIKVSRDGGQSWTAVQQLKSIATNNGEFDFSCGAFANGPSNYQDKEIFGNECSMTEMVFPPGLPQVRFAVLYPGGVAFSGDGGNTWVALNATNADPSQQPIELPQSAFYDPTLNSSGNSSLYVALEGKGVKRIDAPYATLGSGIKPLQTFQLAGSDQLAEALVIGTDGKLWLEQPPFGKVPPNRQEVDANTASVWAVDVNHLLVLGADHNLWLEESPFGNVPPRRQLVDANVRNFQPISTTEVFVLGTNWNLWLEQAPFGTVPPVRQQVDVNVGSFQAVDANNVFTLGTDGNLWLEQGPFGHVPPGRKQVDGNVESFQANGTGSVLVLGKDAKLWWEQAPFGSVPPQRQQVDANVRSFQPMGSDHAFVLGANGNLWLDQAPFGNVPPARLQVDVNVGSFEAIDLNDVLVLGTDRNLWWEKAPFGNVPPSRSQIDANVQMPIADF